MFYQKQERLRDLEDRDAFAKRLQEKDRAKTRHVASVSDKRAYEEAAKRLKLEQVCLRGY